MSFTTWFHAHQPTRTPALNKPRGRKSSRRPVHSRPTLECLEERMMLDAGASNGVLPGANNPTFNSSQVSDGMVLPMAAALSQQNASLTGTNWQAANVISTAYGFGSGNDPNAPWMPKAYNVGLANHQYGYPSQTDVGFGPAPPWTYPTAQILPKEQNPLLNHDLDIKIDEQEAVKPDEVQAHRLLEEQEQPQPTRLDEDADDEVESDKAALEEQTPQKQPSLDRILDQDGYIPDSVWLSALAPAPMAALVAGLPGLAEATETASGDGGGEAAD